MNTDRFLSLACIDYERWRKGDAEAAQRLLADEPEIARTNIWAAAAAGDVDAATAMLDADPSLVHAKRGPREWEPLMYACYSRVDAPTLDVARLLLERGADPNAGFLWDDNVPPFTALTGVFGEGEDSINEPPHRDRDALARLLLDAGADPNDGQVLYNKHFRSDDAHLRLLFEYGLGTDKHGPWFERLGDRLQSPSRLLVEELWSAARKNYFERVKLLVEHGAEVDTPGVRDGRTPYEAAMRFGQHDVARYLLEHGAKKSEPTLSERFAAACISGRRDEALELLREHPELPEQLGLHGRIELVHRAVEARRPEAVRLLAELGFEINGMTQHDSVGMSLAATPLHNATWNLPMVKVLIELGANPHIRERNYHATPLGWATHGENWEVANYLMQFATIFDAVANGGVERVAELLRGDPSLIHAVDEQGDPLVFYVWPWIKRLDEMVALLVSHGADFQPAIERARKSGNEEFAKRLRGAVGS
jgi:ankyrin repeat protein